MPPISPANSIDYYERIVARMGGESKDFIRLFMVPGLQHCFNGNPGRILSGKSPNSPVGDAEHDVLSAVERWVEEGVGPEKIIATIESDL